MNVKQKGVKLMKNAIDKGMFGYIDNQKKKKCVIAVISVAMVFVIFFTGIILYDTKKSLFSVIAAVSALPAAKLLISFIMVAPYKSGKKDIYDKIVAQTVNTNILCDMIVTSEEKSMHLDFILVKAGKIICFSSTDKLDEKVTVAYLKKIIDQSCNFSSLRLYKNEEHFLQAINEFGTNEALDEATANMDEKICKRIKTFSV